MIAIVTIVTGLPTATAENTDIDTNAWATAGSSASIPDACPSGCLHPG